MNTHRIAWRSKLTGACGGGSVAIGDVTEVEQIAERLNEQWPEIDHWAEPMPSTPPARAPGEGQDRGE